MIKREKTERALLIPVLLGSVREGRQSANVSQLIWKQLSKNSDVQTKLIDLKAYQLPVLEERLGDMKNPPTTLLDFCSQVSQVDALLIVAPEYKNGYPGALKNALDYLEPQVLRRKPIGICTVSSGGLGGLNCLMQLRLVCLALGGMPIPEKLLVSKVGEVFDSEGNLRDPSLTSKIDTFIKALVWYSKRLAQDI
ncbi:NAD(P)H-dependent oxidoreductase [Leptolyngbya cf. ectocarpi LEGE 11479]|uniref:NAD(P)H-dependent oxidoreductase n=1 Tax=Leptolyngbya cf. ectocarpi LEGE 11479 TaxID=1828722 RepID=A0A929F8W5_LEPEC|nr:NADPH-dependent FMN reductase [Leptolyngbya ectocarpi]MBE9069036.1 NAD(P)H-dependent oxidoreductase [Leptolyngbya cf. ectocarpi LEGE 11479]